MNLIFKSIVINNFKCFVGKHEFAFAELGNGLHFLRGNNEVEPKLGSNGAGKSSLLGSLQWCLFGKTSEGLKNPDIKPWYGKGATSVLTVFDIDDKEYNICRGTEPNFLHLDDKDCAQENIDALLQLNYDIFSHTILLGQGKPLFFDLAPKAKLELFSDVLNLERWDQRSDKASAKTKTFQERQIRYRGELSGVALSFHNLMDSIDSIKIKSEAWSKEQEQKLNELRIKLKDNKKELEKTSTLKDAADLIYDGSATELKALIDSNRKTADEFQQITEQYHKAITKVEVLKRDKIRIENELKNLGDLDNCPTCGQKLKGTSLASHIKELKNNITDLANQIKKGEPVELAKKKETIQNRIHQNVEHTKQFEAKASEARSSLDRLIPIVSQLQAFIRVNEQKIIEDEQAENPYRDQLQQLRKQKTQLVSDMNELKEKLQNIEELLERYKFWVKGFKDVRLYIVDEVLQELEIVTNTMLEEIGLVGWAVQYDIERETKSGTVARGLNVIIQSPTNKEPVKWESWSGGEAQRLRLVSALALSEVLLNYAGVLPNLEILDEPTRGLSNTNGLVEILANRAAQLNKIVILIDHRTIESASFDSTITVTKTKKGSFIS